MQTGFNDRAGDSERGKIVSVTPIEETLCSLSEEINRASALTHEISGRIAVVLKDSEPKNPGPPEKEEPPPTCQLHGQLHDRLTEVRSLANQLQDIMMRLVL